MRNLVAYAATLLAFLAIDLVWLGVVAKQFYRREMGDLLASPFQLMPALAFYLLYPAGVVFFAVMPALNSSGFTHALLLGVGLGLFAYGTYDLTNLATVKNWPQSLALIDMTWGAVLTGLAATFGWWAAKSW